jgi:hypothetical protein
MDVGLSSAACPDLDLASLLTACGYRRLVALELVAGHGHGLSPSSPPEAIRSAREAAAAAGIALAAYRAASVEEAFAPETAALGAALGAPVVLPAGLAFEEAALAAALEHYRTARAALAVGHRSDASRVQTLRDLADGAPEGTLRLTWEVSPFADSLGTAIPTVIRAAGPYLRQVRLLGGGPEAARQEGRGFGVLMAQLALVRFGGVLFLAPSASSEIRAWAGWLGLRQSAAARTGEALAHAT